MSGPEAPAPSWATMPEGSILRSCGEEGWTALASGWSEQNLGRDVQLISSGEGDRDVFFILSGRVRVTSYASNGRAVPFVDLGPGACVGELAALDGAVRSSNVITLEETRVARLSATKFERALMENRAVLRAIAGYLAGRVRDLSSRLLDITTMDASGRLLARLLGLAVSHPGVPDRACIDPLPTQQELADAIFGQREAVARQLSALAKDGLIVRKGRRLEIPSLTALHKRLSDDRKRAGRRKMDAPRHRSGHR